MDQVLPHRMMATRPDLERYRGQLRDLSQRPRPGGLTPEQVRAETSYVQGRLDGGDFQVGDRLLITVEDPGPVAAGAPKSVEQQLSDTFTVASGQQLTLPGVGTISLRGVLRAELEPFLIEHIGQYVRDPVVHAHPLLTLAVSGGVTRPGYYPVPVDAVIPAVFTAAGGVTKDAKLDDLKIRRDGRVIWSGDALRRAVAGGRTVDELDLHAGDELMLPSKNNGGYESLRFVAVLLSIPLSIYSLSKIF
jgi:protein involved in polysaccharide export with SLBB domain